MVAASFIQLRDGSVLAANNILHIALDRDTVVFAMRDSVPVSDPWPTGEGAAAYANYLNLLEVTIGSGSITFIEIEPPSVPHNQWSLARTVIILKGTNFPPGSYIEINGFAFTGYINSSYIYGVWAADDMTVGTYDVNVRDSGGNVIFTQAAAFTVT